MKWRNKIGRRWTRRIVTALIAALVLAALSIAAAAIRKIPDSERLAERWSSDGGYTQISVFYTKEASPTVTQLETFEHSLDSSFLEAGIEAPTQSARLYVSAYSASGKISVTGSKGTISAPAIGVGGDFFLFHPFKLVSGYYFSGSDVMQDGIVIDEDAAWQLFGASDVAGMTVTIGGVPHYIAGVISRDSSLMDKKAGADTMTVYLSYDSLSKYGTTDGISCYETLLPNPVSGYGLGLVKEKLGVSDSTGVVVENSERYSVLSLLKVIGSFGTRSMQTMGIVWPGWENAARGWEDVLALLLVFQILCVAVLAGIGLIALGTGYGAVKRMMWRKKAKREWDE